MIELFHAPTPNGWKVSIMLAECELPFTLRRVKLKEGDQFRPDFLAISPNNRIPAIVDHEPQDAAGPLAVFESGAVLTYLAEKTGRFLPRAPRARTAVNQWLMWQVSGLGPMLGQHGHFKLYAKEKLPYAIERYAAEAKRLYAVLDAQLERTGDCVAGEYSIADMACFPWVMTHKAQGFTLDDWPHIKRWYTALRARTRLQEGLAVGTDEVASTGQFDNRARHYLFGAAAAGVERGKGQP